MNAGHRIPLLALVVAPALSQAGDGLSTPAAEALWPRWQARISVQAAAVSPLDLSSPLGRPAAQPAWRGASVLGDFYFATQASGGFRASGGVMSGLRTLAPMWAGPSAPAAVMSVQPALAGPAGDVGGGFVPYLGLGYSGVTWRSGLSLSADFGLVAERPGATGALGRALLGARDFDSALREIRLAPVFQLGVRYSF